MAEGLRNKEIAALLQIAERTVETHVQRILSKLSLRGRVRLAASVAKAGGVKTLARASAHRDAHKVIKARGGINMEITQLGSSARRIFCTMFLTILTVLATASVASAQVIDSGHTVTTNVVTNPCDPIDGLIVITTDTRWETRLQPDGTVVSHFHNHSEGVSANGTKYIANRQATTTTTAGSTTAQVEVEIRRISAGPGDNAVFTVTGTVPGTLTTTVRCVG